LSCKGFADVGLTRTCINLKARKAMWNFLILFVVVGTSAAWPETGHAERFSGHTVLRPSPAQSKSSHFSMQAQLKPRESSDFARRFVLKAHLDHPSQKAGASACVLASDFIFRGSFENTF
jgi:hypothetical protein